jgi:K+-transporting ATPase A subunit
MRFGLISVAYIVVGVLVAAGVIGNEGNYFEGMNNLEEIVEMVLAVLLWPLVLLDVNINIGTDDGGSNGATSDGAPEGGGGGGGGGGK